MITSIHILAILGWLAAFTGFFQPRYQLGRGGKKLPSPAGRLTHFLFVGDKGNSAPVTKGAGQVARILGEGVVIMTNILSATPPIVYGMGALGFLLWGILQLI